MPIKSLSSNFQRSDPLRTAFRSGQVADRQGAQTGSSSAINVKAGDIASASDNHSLLHTCGLFDCAALCLLSDKDSSGVYRNRKLAHLLGGDISNAMRSTPSKFADFINSVKNDAIQEVILVNGIHAKSNMAFETTIGQAVNGQPILKTLLEKNNIKFTAIVSSEVTIDSKGGWKTDGQLRRTLDLLEKQKIINDCYP
jgi:hypothetical protein